MGSEPPQIEGTEHRRQDLADFTVHYAEAGDPSAPALLMLHGWPQHHAMWGPVIERLKDRFRMIAPDLRGFGWSEAPGHGYDCDTFARDQVELLDALGIERANVIGHDWGGWTAFLLGLDHAERIERMVVCNAPHPWVKPRPRLALEAWRSWYAALNALPALGPRLVPRMARAILTRGHVSDPFGPEEVQTYIEQFRDPARAAAASQLYRYYFRVFASGFRGGFESKRLAPPTLLLFGDRDFPLTPKLVERPEDYKGRADEFRVELVPASGHFVVEERTDLVTERALSHFS